MLMMYNFSWIAGIEDKLKTDTHYRYDELNYGYFVVFFLDFLCGCRELFIIAN